MTHVVSGLTNAIIYAPSTDYSLLSVYMSMVDYFSNFSEGETAGLISKALQDSPSFIQMMNEYIDALPRRIEEKLEASVDDSQMSFQQAASQGIRLPQPFCFLCVVSGMTDTTLVWQHPHSTRHQLSISLQILLEWSHLTYHRHHGKALPSLDGLRGSNIQLLIKAKRWLLHRLSSSSCLTIYLWIFTTTKARRIANNEASSVHLIFQASILTNPALNSPIVP